MKLNTTTLEGNLTRDPEIHTTTGGMVILAATLGHNRPVKNKQTGQWETEPHFFDIKAFGRQAEWHADLTKGAPLVVTGRLQQETWTDKTSGQKRSRVVIIADEIRRLERRAASASAAAPASTPGPGDHHDHDDEEVPF